MIANMPALDIKPGSMGRPLPGVDAFIVDRDVDGNIVMVDEPDREGRIGAQGWLAFNDARLPQ